MLNSNYWGAVTVGCSREDAESEMGLFDKETERPNDKQTWEQTRSAGKWDHLMGVITK